MLPNTFPGTLALLQSHGYAIMFAVMLLEGPIVSYVAGFAASLYLFNVYAVLALAVLGSWLGDIPYYFLGRWSKQSRLEKYVGWFGVDKKVMRQIERNYKKHPGKTLLVVKITPAIPIPGIILAGAAEVPFPVFLGYSMLISIPYALFFVLLGYYSGVTYDALAKYLRVGAIIPLIIVCALVVWLLFRLLSARIGKRLEKRI